MRQSAEAAKQFTTYKEDSERRHAEVTTRYEEVRTAKDQAVKALDASQSLVATNEKETANALSDLRLVGLCRLTPC